MAKKFVRGITDVKTINNQDFDTNNVNDLLSDGQYNYIHRKKGKNEEYHNLTDNIKTISSDNTELLTVTNNNKTTNTATLSPKHDAQKEQVLESTRNTVTIKHGTNGTPEKTTVDTNPQKVLEHENLISDSEYITLDHQTDVNKTHIKTEKLKEKLDNLQQTKQDVLTAGDGLAIKNNEIKIKPKNVETLPANSGFYNGAFIDGEWENPYASISLNIDTNKLIQLAFRESVNTGGLITAKYRFIVNNVPTSWKEMQLDSVHITSLLAQKQDTLVAGNGITIQGNTISATGSSTSTVQHFIDSNYRAYVHRVTSSTESLVTLSFECYNAAETVLTGELKQYLAPYVEANTSISNGAISITNDGTTMKLINSAPSKNLSQHATFTFPGIVS